MDQYNKFEIDGEDLYVENLTINGLDSFSPLKLDEKQMEKALRPVVKLGKKIKEGLNEMTPDEVEISLQLAMGIENNTFFLGLVTGKAEAQFTVKMVWKDN